MSPIICLEKLRSICVYLLTSAVKIQPSIQTEKLEHLSFTGNATGHDISNPINPFLDYINEILSALQSEINPVYLPLSSILNGN